MQTMTLQEAQVSHERKVDTNRRKGVVEYKNGEKLSDRVFEVTEGLKYLPGGKVIGPGNRFHPTERQVQALGRGKGGLAGKARELTQSEYDSIGRSERKPMSTGADIGVRSLPMAEGVLRLALEAGLTESDFESLEPGHKGQFTRAQVEELIEVKQARSADA